jgi:hypothetical protein
MSSLVVVLVTPIKPSKADWTSGHDDGSEEIGENEGDNPALRAAREPSLKDLARATPWTFSCWPDRLHFQAFAKLLAKCL